MQFIFDSAVVRVSFLPNVYQLPCNQWQSPTLIGAVLLSALCSHLTHTSVKPAKELSNSAAKTELTTYRFKMEQWENQRLSCSSLGVSSDTEKSVTLLAALALSSLCSHQGQHPGTVPPPTDDRLPRDCGRSMETASYRARGVKLGEFPWMARVGREIRRVYEDYCGGSLITERHVITTAYCIRRASEPKSEYKVRFGVMVPEHRRSDGSDMSLIHVYSVDKYIVHEGYDNDTKTNDIAIIKLKGKIFFFEYIRPICLPQDGGKVAVEKNSAVYAGWVQQKEGFIKGILMKATKVTSTDRCENEAQSKNANLVIDDRVVCGTVNKGACINTYGGPLMSRRVDGRWTLDGLSSWDSGDCATEETAVVFTRVSSYMTWILSHLDD